jgi:alkanesulfonate monooxygenase SsuD/methylene tetrahydromethanopterin reductase-like flavin-dependent oxidoreductase (luciferase family)
MKFGIFYEMQIPRPWEAHSEHKLLNDALAQVELADRLGYDFAWEVEHHYLEEYSHSSAPGVFLGAASQRTRNIRLAHGIMHMTTNHPSKVAAQVATLDLLSHGRVELGLGESASSTELDPFGVTFENKREIFEDAVRCMIPMFKDMPSEYEGPHFKFPYRNVVPKPLQKPHPPLWVACSQLPTIEYCGRKGMGALGFQFVSADAAHAWVHAYYNAITKRLDKLADYPINPNIALVSYFMCAKTDEEAQKRAEGLTFFQFALKFYGQSANRERPRAGTVNVWKEFQKWKDSNPDAVQKSVRSGLVGSPDTIRKKLRKFQSSNVDQIIFLNQAGKNPHEHICEGLELFAREVMPEFHAAEVAHQDWKRGVLSGEIQLEEIDTQPFRDRFGHLAAVAPKAEAAE